MRRKLIHATSAIVRFGKSKIRRKPNNKKMILSFAERCNLVYFGFVSQLDDEHRMVRGLTVSTKHQDHHYCIGTYHGYDVVFVERSDTLLTSGHAHTWHILGFDLKQAADMPHLFIGSSTHGLGFDSLLKAKYSFMTPVNLGVLAPYPAEFTSHFNIYSIPTQAITAEQLIDTDMAQMIGSHFKGLVVEIIDSYLYVYSEKAYLSGSLLDTMIANGVWLADKIDEKSQRV